VALRTPSLYRRCRRRGWSSFSSISRLMSRGNTVRSRGSTAIRAARSSIKTRIWIRPVSWRGHFLRHCCS